MYVNIYQIISVTFVLTAIVVLSNIAQLNYVLVSIVVGFISILLFFYTQNDIFLYVLNNDFIHLVGEIGICLLFFYIGLHINFNKVLQLYKYIIKILAIQIVLGLPILFFMHIFIFNFNYRFAIVGSSLILVTSSSVCTQLLMQDEFSDRYAQIAFAILIIQDILSVLLIAIMKDINTVTMPVYNIFLDILKVLFCMLLIFPMSKLIFYIEKILILYFNENDKLKIFSTIYLLLFLISLSIAKYFSINYEFILFISGYLLTYTEIKQNIEDFINIIYQIPMSAYFVISVFNTKIEFVLSYIILSYFVKYIINFIAAYFSGLTIFESIKFSTSMLSGSELAYHSYISECIILYKIVFSCSLSILCSILLFPSVLYAENSNNTGIAIKDAVAQTCYIYNHIIIIGFSKITESILDFIYDNTIPCIVIDNNIKVVIDKRLEYRNIFYMNSTDPSTYKHLNINSASMVIITIKSISSIISTIKSIRIHNNKINIAVLCFSKLHYNIIQDAGAIPISIEFGVTGESLTEYIFTKCKW